MSEFKRVPLSELTELNKKQESGDVVNSVWSIILILIGIGMTLIVVISFLAVFVNLFITYLILHSLLHILFLSIGYLFNITYLKFKNLTPIKSLRLAFLISAIIIILTTLKQLIF